MRTPRLAITFTVGEGEEPGALEGGDALVAAPNGDRWGAKMLTMRK